MELDSKLLQVSVVIPTYKRHALLIRCLEALDRQTLSAERFEVIVADDAADPETQALIEAHAERSPYKLVYAPVHSDPPGTHGPAVARNASWRRAAAEVIAFTDDDCVPDPSWLAEGLHVFDDPACAAAWGRLEMPIPEVPTDYERDASGLATAVFVTANCFVRRAVMKTLGGFDERFQVAWREDSDLYFSLLEQGFQVVHARQALVVHPVRSAPWGISLYQQRKTMFDVLLYEKHLELYCKHVAPFPRLYLVIITSGLIAALSALVNYSPVSVVAMSIWFIGTLYFAAQRLRGTSHSLSHICEMLYTSMLLPWLATAYRILGMYKFRNRTVQASADPCPLR